MENKEQSQLKRSFLLRRKKVRIAGYAPSLTDPLREIICYTESGGRLVLRNHPEHMTWYASADGRFFHLTKHGMREVAVCYGPAMARRVKSDYPVLIYDKKRGTSSGRKMCHHFMWEVWHGARVQGMEIDHVNGNKLDWRLCNLDLVPPSENRRRASILRRLRKGGIVPDDVEPEVLRRFFSRVSLSDPAEVMERSFRMMD